MRSTIPSNIRLSLFPILWLPHINLTPQISHRLKAIALTFLTHRLAAVPIQIQLITAVIIGILSVRSTKPQNVPSWRILPFCQTVTYTPLKKKSRNGIHVCMNVNNERALVSGKEDLHTYTLNFWGKGDSVRFLLLRNRKGRIMGQ